jgi:hypothetical protein
VPPDAGLREGEQGLVDENAAGVLLVGRWRRRELQWGAGRGGIQELAERGLREADEVVVHANIVVEHVDEHLLAQIQPPTAQPADHSISPGIGIYVEEFLICKGGAETPRGDVTRSAREFL